MGKTETELIVSICGDHRLEFNEKTHKYKLDGEYVPGATTVTKAAMPQSEALIKWRIKQGIEEFEKKTRLLKAAAIGTLVHQYAEAVTTRKGINEVLAKIEQEPDKVKILNGCRSFEQWYSKNQPDEIVGQEEIVASTCYRFAGKFDLLVRRGRQLILLDYKTSSGIYTDQFLQLALYRQAIAEWKQVVVDAIEIVRFGKDAETVETKRVEDYSLLNAFRLQALRNVETYYFLKEFGD